jgi:hypothetical protein
MSTIQACFRLNVAATRLTLFRVSEESSIQVHPSGRHGNTVWMPVSVRQVKGFPSHTQIWEDSYNLPDVRSTLSRHSPL